MSALQGMDMLMYSYEEKCIPLNAPLAWFEYGLELSYCVLSTSMFPSHQKIAIAVFCSGVQLETCLIMSSACTISSSSVVRRCISLSTSSGTLVVHLQWNVGVFCYLHRQWYVDVYLFLPPVGRW